MVDTSSRSGQRDARDADVADQHDGKNQQSMTGSAVTESFVEHVQREGSVRSMETMETLTEQPFTGQGVDSVEEKVNENKREEEDDGDDDGEIQTDAESNVNSYRDVAEDAKTQPLLSETEQEKDKAQRETGNTGGAAETDDEHVTVADVQSTGEETILGPPRESSAENNAAILETHSDTDDVISSSGHPPSSKPHLLSASGGPIKDRDLINNEPASAQSHKESEEQKADIEITTEKQRTELEKKNCCSETESDVYIDQSGAVSLDRAEDSDKQPAVETEAEKQLKLEPTAAETKHVVHVTSSVVDSSSHSRQRGARADDVADTKQNDGKNQQSITGSAVTEQIMKHMEWEGSVRSIETRTLTEQPFTAWQGVDSVEEKVNENKQEQEEDDDDEIQTDAESNVNSCRDVAEDAKTQPLLSETEQEKDKVERETGNTGSAAETDDEHVTAAGVQSTGEETKLEPPRGSSAESNASILEMHSDIADDISSSRHPPSSEPHLPPTSDGQVNDRDPTNNELIGALSQEESEEKNAEIEIRKYLSSTEKQRAELEKKNSCSETERDGYVDQSGAVSLDRAEDIDKQQAVETEAEEQLKFEPTATETKTGPPTVLGSEYLPSCEHRLPGQVKNRDLKANEPVSAQSQEKCEEQKADTAVQEHLSPNDKQKDELEKEIVCSGTAVDNTVMQAANLDQAEDSDRPLAAESEAQKQPVLGEESESVGVLPAIKKQTHDVETKVHVCRNDKNQIVKPPRPTNIIYYYYN